MRSGYFKNLKRYKVLFKLKDTNTYDLSYYYFSDVVTDCDTSTIDGIRAKHYIADAFTKIFSTPVLYKDTVFIDTNAKEFRIIALYEIVDEKGRVKNLSAKEELLRLPTSEVVEIQAEDYIELYKAIQRYLLRQSMVQDDDIKIYHNIGRHSRYRNDTT